MISKSGILRKYTSSSLNIEIINSYIFFEELQLTDSLNFNVCFVISIVSCIIKLNRQVLEI